MTYAEVATALERPTADAARMMVVRALERLADEMARQRADKRGPDERPGSKL
jgi:hypothetical protein